MRKQVHILNGDSLKEQFPDEIQGELIVARECLVDGSVEGKNLDELYQTRAHFISNIYGKSAPDDYYKKTVSEFEKIQNIPADSDINLWFEDDLFCQVNFWFVAHLLKNSIQSGNTAFLIRPETHNQFGFAGLSQTELVSIYKHRIILSKLDKIAALWKSYQKNDTKRLHQTAGELKKKLPFILRAVEAHIARIPVNDNPGRPVLSLKEIIKELDTEEFAPVFREFCKRESIYGFGDLQVKQMMDEIKDNR